MPLLLAKMALASSNSLLKEVGKPKYKPIQIVRKMQEEGYRRFTIGWHTELWQSLGAQDPANGFGVLHAREPRRGRTAERWTQGRHPVIAYVATKGVLRSLPPVRHQAPMGLFFASSSGTDKWCSLVWELSAGCAEMPFLAARSHAIGRLVFRIGRRQHRHCACPEAVWCF